MVTTALAAGKAAALEIEFADGRLPAISGAGPTRARPGAKPPPEQGDLF